MVVCALALVPSAGRAQTATTAPGGEASAAGASGEDTAARARALFAEGVRLVGEHELRDAEARFREALALRDAPAIRYNLASVLFERGRLTEADALARSAAADEAAPADIREHATALSEQIAAAAGFVRLDVIGEGASVTIDDYTLGDLAAEFPVSAGEHLLVASSAGVERSRETITIAAGEHRVVPVDATAPEDAELADVEPVDGEGSDTASRPLVEEPALWIGVGVGVVLITAFVIGAAVASSGPEAPIEGNFNPGVIRW